MASSTGSFRRSRRPWSRLGTLGLAALGAVAAARAALPDYVREALGAFSAEPPARWAYTTTTVRPEASTAERYDPAQPPAARWTLLTFNGQPPTGKELEKYRKLRSANPLPSSPANFQRGDIDPGSLRLVSEDVGRAEYEGGFREVSAAGDKMLGHLILRLTINKHTPHVEKFTLTLREPYSPILGVKMNSLKVEMTFAPPAPARPCLPVAYTSHFSGRIFFIGTQEDLQVAYSDFSPAGEAHSPGHE